MAAASLLEIPKNRGSKRSWNVDFLHGILPGSFTETVGTKKQQRSLFGVVFLICFKHFHEISGVVSPIFCWGFHIELFIILQWGRLRYTRVCVLICDDACEILCFNKRRKIYVKHCKPLNVNCSESPLCFGTQIEVVTITRMSQQVSKRFATIFGLITWLVFYPSTSWPNSPRMIPRLQCD